MAKIKNPNQAETQELPLKKDKLGLNKKQQPKLKEKPEPYDNLEEARRQIIDTLDVKTLASKAGLPLEGTFDLDKIVKTGTSLPLEVVGLPAFNEDLDENGNLLKENVHLNQHKFTVENKIAEPEPEPKIFEGINESTTGFSEPVPKPSLNTNVLIARLQMLNTLEGSDYEQLMLDVTDYMQTKDSLFMHTTDSVLTGYLIHLLEQISPNFNLTYQEEHTKTYATGVTKTNGLTVTAEHQFTVIALLLLYIKLTFM